MEKSVIDLFAGCGGLSLGFEKNGFTVLKAVEIDSAIAETYKANHPHVNVIVDDIGNIDRTGVFGSGEASVIIGGPPCQGFSMAGARIREGFMGDPRNYLFKHYFNVVKTVKPAVFIMENVKGLLTMEKGRIFDEIKRIFSDPALLDGEAYHITHTVVRAVQMGIPQKRERVIIIGTLKECPVEKLWEAAHADIEKDIPSFFAPVTVNDAIGNLPPPTADGIIPNPAPVTDYQRYLACTADVLHNHCKTNHSPKAVERMKRISAGENFTSLGEKINSVHSGAYGRLDGDAPAPTVTTRFDTPAGGRFIHPAEDRTLTPREAARIQSFPDGFIFHGSRTAVCRTIGNAVPPKISYFLARLAEKLLEEQEM